MPNSIIAPSAAVVAELKRLGKRSDADGWRMAELIAGEVDRGVSTALLGEAAEPKVTAHTITVYARVWRRYGRTSGSARRPFAEAYALAKTSEQAAGELEDAAELTGRAVQALRAAGPEARAKAVVKALEDPEVRKAIREEPADRDAIIGVAGEALRERADASDRRARANNPRLERGADVTSALADLATARYRIRRALDAMRRADHLTDGEAETALDLVASVENTLGWARSFLESGDRGFEAELEALLAGEGRG